MRAHRIQFTDASVARTKPPARGYIHLYDSLSPLGLRINAGGTRTFFVMTAPGQREVIGRYPVVDLAAARVRARNVLTTKALGLTRLTFEEAFTLFLDKKAWRKPRTKRDADRHIRKYFLPDLRRKALPDVQPADIITVVDGIQARSEAAHAHAAIRAFFNWCRKRSYIKHSPVEMEVPYKSPSRTRVLSDRELKAIWEACERAWSSLSSDRSSSEQPPSSLSVTFARLVQLLILTGQRRGEMGAFNKEWIHAQHVTMPKEVTKNGREHTFPIGRLTAALLRERVDASEGSVLFPSKGTTDKPFSGWSKGKSDLDKASGITGWTLHDLRRTFATRLAELGVQPHIIERLLNHITGSLTPLMLTYNRARYEKECREAIDLWDRYLQDEVLASGNAAGGHPLFSESGHGNPEQATGNVQGAEVIRHPLFTAARGPARDRGEVPQADTSLRVSGGLGAS